MRILGFLLISFGLLSFIFTLAGTPLLPERFAGAELALLVLGVGIFVLWMDERQRHRRKWKGLANKPKFYE